MADSVTALSIKYLQQNPQIRACLLAGMINYSALARQICRELKLDNFDAIVAACRRYQSKIRKKEDHSKAVIKLLEESRLRMKNKISVVIIEKPRDFESIFSLQRRIRKERGTLQFIEGEEAVTIIVESQDLEEIRKSFAGRIKKITNGLTQILMIFNKNIETTPGVIAYIYALLGANNINIVEEMSCWTDVMLIVSEKDAPLAAELISHSK